MNKLQAIMKMSALIARPYLWQDEAVLLEATMMHDYLTPDYDIVPCEPSVVRQRLIKNRAVGIIDENIYVGIDVWWDDYEGCWMTTQPGDYTHGYVPSDEPRCPIESALFFLQNTRNTLRDK